MYWCGLVKYFRIGLLVIANVVRSLRCRDGPGAGQIFTWIPPAQGERVCDPLCCKWSTYWLELWLLCITITNTWDGNTYY